MATKAKKPPFQEIPIKDFRPFHAKVIGVRCYVHVPPLLKAPLDDERLAKMQLPQAVLNFRKKVNELRELCNTKTMPDVRQGGHRILTHTQFDEFNQAARKIAPEITEEWKAVERVWKKLPDELFDENFPKDLAESDHPYGTVDVIYIPYPQDWDHVTGQDWAKHGEGRPKQLGEILRGELTDGLTASVIRYLAVEVNRITEIVRSMEAAKMSTEEQTKVAQPEVERLKVDVDEFYDLVTKRPKNWKDEIQPYFDRMKYLAPPESPKLNDDGTDPELEKLDPALREMLENHRKKLGVTR
jgi:hypothetical protein